MTGIICHHDQLARSCYTCELESNVERLTKERDELQQDSISSHVRFCEIVIEIAAIKDERDELLSDVQRCYDMLLGTVNTNEALMKAEGILREAITRVKEGK